MKKVAPREYTLRMIQPFRDGKNVWLEIDGKRIDLHPMEVGLITEAWNSAMRGAYVAAVTK